MADRRVYFWARVDRRKPDECWLWRGADPTKYHRFSFDGHAVLAHRVAWELTHGPIPPGKMMLHSCDVPACVNPRHLRPGTAAENSADMVARGRQRPHDQRTAVERVRGLTRQDGECWIWIGTRQKCPQIRSVKGSGTVRAARVMYEAEHGPIPPYRHIRSVCGNKLCVRPEHLTLLVRP